MTLLKRFRLQDTLTTTLDHLVQSITQDEYRLVGTGAALLHGVELPARDIDLLAKEREVVDRFSEALSPFKCLTPPVFLPEDRQYYANFKVNGIEVGASTVEWETTSDGIECLGRGPWEHFVLLACGNYQVPTIALELRLVSELLRNRPDRYKPLIKHMRMKGCNIALLSRGMKAQQIHKAVQTEVLNQLNRKT